VSNQKKITAEANWFLKLPKPLTFYTPKLIDVDDQRGTYTLEYLYLLPLNDLFIYGHLKANAWKTIFKACQEFMQELSSFRLSQDELLPHYDYLKKTKSRLEGVDLNTLEIADESAKYIPNLTLETTVLTHGDFCFSNILYDSRLQSIKVIDPRGVDFDDSVSLYGDGRYDLAKLYHSVIGLYDFIIADRFEIVSGTIVFELSHEQQLIQKIFVEMFLSDKKLEQEIIAINVHLFLSMIPLHSDQPMRQKAMMLNAVRLFKILQKKVVL
jgi:hypothetical protein